MGREEQGTARSPEGLTQAFGTALQAAYARRDYCRPSATSSHAPEQRNPQQLRFLPVDQRGLSLWACSI